MKKITEFLIEDHGVEHAQYFQGVGLSGTYWKDLAVGIGHTFHEALADAMDILAQGDWSVEGDFENQIFEEHEESDTICNGCDYCGNDEEEIDECELCELNHYAVIYVK